MNSADTHFMTLELEMNNVKKLSESKLHEHTLLPTALYAYASCDVLQLWFLTENTGSLKVLDFKLLKIRFVTKLNL